MPGPEAAGRVVERVRAALGDLVRGVEEHKGFVTVYVDPGSLVRAASLLKGMGFDHVKSVTVVDLVKENALRVGYHVSSYSNPELARVVLELATIVPREGDVRVPSLVGVWPSAEFQEREVYEFFGVVFEGHPDLRPLYLTPDLAEKKPLRKDFKVEEEGIYLD
ncbi:NADH-quinone oxidoreductase subunit C [Stetteria hydrogenophila]